jgi:hypothetical protein
MNAKTVMALMAWFWASWEFYNIYPLESGLVRRKVRLDRRPGMPIESAWTFYPRQVFELVAKNARLIAMYAKLYWKTRAIKRDPAAKEYRDLALTTQTGGDVDNLAMFELSESARQAGAKARRVASKLEKMA